jgi:beta-glucanase (GH16 family)
MILLTVLVLALNPATAALCASCPCLSSSRMATDGGGTYSCRDRVTWVMNNKQLDEDKACLVVHNEFPSICTYNETICATSLNCGNSGNDVVVQSAAVTSSSCPSLTWRDEFSGSSLNRSKWNYQTGDGCDIGLCGWGNNELQSYQSANVKIANGKLVIVARKQSVGGKQYTSGRIRTKGLADFKYGRLEALIKVPRGNGLWPAFWLLPTEEKFGSWPMSGEIDIMENIGREPSRVHGTLHYGKAWPENQYQGLSIDKLDNKYVADMYHEFAVDWSPDKISWSMDGGHYLELTNQTISPWPFTEKFHFILNIAIGGTWPGSPDETTSFPQQMQVDYVRVYDKSPGRLKGPMYVDSGATGLRFNMESPLTDYTYSWSVPNGTTITSSNPSSSSAINVTWGSNSGYVKVTAKSNACGVTKTFSLPVKVVAPRTGVIVNCECSQCTSAILHRMAGSYSCLERMEWMAQATPMNQRDACSYVSNEYPAICGPECDPNKCIPTTTTTTSTITTTILSSPLTVLQCAKVIVNNCGCGQLKSTCTTDTVTNSCASDLSDTALSSYNQKAFRRAKNLCG